MAVIVPSLLVAQRGSVLTSDSAGVEKVSIEKLSKLTCSCPMVLTPNQYLRSWIEPVAVCTLTSSKTLVVLTHTSALSFAIDSVVEFGPT